MTKHCACCGKPFQPRPQIPHQAFCSAPGCQRARKRHWQRAKLQTDPDYRINQRAAQQAWQEGNPDYWRNHRRVRSDRAYGDHEPHRSRTRNGQNEDRDVSPAKMDVCDLPAGLYRITQHPAFSRGPGQPWVVEITPLCTTCPCRMDASREDVIDTPTRRP